MPTYNMRNVETGEVVTVTVTLAERQEMLASGQWIQELAAPSFVTMPGGTLSRTSSDWKDLLKKIQKGSGKDNTIKV